MTPWAYAHHLLCEDIFTYEGGRSAYLPAETVVRLFRRSGLAILTGHNITGKVCPKAKT